MHNLGNQRSGIYRLITDNQGPVWPNPHDMAAGQLYATDGAGEAGGGEGEGAGHLADRKFDG